MSLDPMGTGRSPFGTKLGGGSGAWATPSALMSGMEYITQNGGAPQVLGGGDPTNSTKDGLINAMTGVGAWLAGPAAPFVPLGIGLLKSLFGKNKKMKAPKLQSEAPRFLALSSALRQQNDLDARNMLDVAVRGNAGPSAMQKIIQENQRGGLRLSESIAQRLQEIGLSERRAQFEADLRAAEMNQQNAWARDQGMNTALGNTSQLLFANRALKTADERLAERNKGG